MYILGMSVLLVGVAVSFVLFARHKNREILQLKDDIQRLHAIEQGRTFFERFGD